MHRCDDCDCIFDEPEEVKENMGECFGFPSYEKYCICPACGSDNIEETEDRNIE